MQIAKRILIITLSMLLLGGVVLAMPKTRRMAVPYTVKVGQTLWDICEELAVRYGDKRDLRDIIAEAKRGKGFIQPGDKLIVWIEVEETHNDYFIKNNY